jgi:hypothetical protein
MLSFAEMSRESVKYRRSSATWRSRKEIVALSKRNPETFVGTHVHLLVLFGLFVNKDILPCDSVTFVVVG